MGSSSRELRALSKVLRAVIAAVFIFQGISPTFVHAQVVLDGTLGGSMGDLVGPDGSMFDHNITENLGTLSNNGKNIFFSFSQFDINANKTANFSGPAGIKNIVSRVTGGQSEIMGTIASTIDSADVFLLNPKGILFGPNATLDIDGSFYASTANKLEIGGGIFDFNTTVGQASELITANVASFGFTNAPPEGNITIKSLDTKGAQTFFVGRNVPKGSSTTPGIEIKEGALLSQNGKVNIVSVGTPNINSNGKVPLTPLNLLDFRGVGFDSLGTIKMQDGEINVVGSGQGSILIRGGELIIENSSTIEASKNTPGSNPTNPAIDVFAKESISIKNSSVFANNTSTGNMGDILFETGNFIFREGTINLDVAPEAMNSASLDVNIANGGNLNINAGRVEIGRIDQEADASGLPTRITAVAGQTRQGGSVEFNVTQLPYGTVLLDENSTPVPAKDIGLVVIQNESTIETDNAGNLGAGGEITIEANVINMKNKVNINSTARGLANGGNITLTANEFRLANGVSIASDAGPRRDSTLSTLGNAGDVTLNIGALITESGPNRVKLDDRIQDSPFTGNLISSTSFTPDGPFGAAGQVIIQGKDVDDNGIRAASLVALNDTTVRTTLEGEGQANERGNIIIRATNLKLENGTRIQADTTGAGDAGSIELNVTNLTTQPGQGESAIRIGLDLDNPTDTTDTTGVLISSSSSSPSTSSGSAGQINIQGTGEGGTTANSINLTDTAVRTSLTGGGESTDGTATAGDILVQGSTITFNNGTRLSADASGVGDAGTITMKVANLTSNGTKGGDIRIPLAETDPPQTTGVLVTSSSGTESTNASALSGAAGTVTLLGTGDENSLAASVSLTDTSIQTILRGQGRGENTDMSEDNIGDSSLNPANITLASQGVQLNNGARIEADTTGTGNAGSITMKVASLTSTGAGPVRIPVDPDDVTQTTGVLISSSSTSPSTGSGNAGTVTIQAPENDTTTAPEVNLTDTRIATTVATGGDGEGGTIQLLSDEDITLTDTTLSANVHDRASNSDTTVASVTVTTPKKLTIQGGGLTAQTTGTRDAGEVALKVGALETNAGPTIETVQLSSSSTSAQPGAGNAGQVTIGGPGSTTTNPTAVPGMIDLVNTMISTAAADPTNAAFNGDGEGGPIIIESSDTITLSDTTLSANVHNAAGDNTSTARGDITIETPGKLTIIGGGLTAETSGSRDAGQVALAVGELETSKGESAVILSSRSTRLQTGGGNAGRVTIGGPGTTPEAPTAVPSNINLAETTIASSVAVGGDAQGGTIQLRGGQAVTLTDTTLSADVHNVDTSDASDSASIAASVTITTPQNLTIQGGSLTAKTTGTRNAGQVNMQVGALETKAGPTIETVQLSSSSTSATAGAGNAGQVTIGGPGSTTTNPTAVPGTIKLANTMVSTAAADPMNAAFNGDGEGGPIIIESSEDITLTDTTLSANVHNATSDDNTATARGDITIETPGKLTIIGGGLTAETSGSRDAGQVTVQVGAFETNAGPSIETVKLSSSSGEGSGNAGDVFINTGSPGAGSTPTSLAFTNTDISTAAHGTGEGGTIELAASQTISLDDSFIAADVAGGTDNPATISTGNITVTAPTLTLTNGSDVTAATSGSRNAGTIQLNADIVTVNDGAAPTATDDARSKISSSSGTGSGNAGDIFINTGASTGSTPTSFAFTNTDISTAANGTGEGGTITLKTTDTIRLDHSTLSADVANGTDIPDPTTVLLTPTGNIRVETPNLTITGGGLTAQSTGERNAGNIDVQVGALITQVGDLAIQVGGQPTTRVQISSSNTGAAANSGNAGSVTIEADSATPNAPVDTAGTIVLNNTDISTAVASNGAGTGGIITITSNGTTNTSLSVTDSSIVATVHDAPSGMANDDLANVTLKGPSTTITGLGGENQNRGIETETTGSRNAGDVNVKTDSFLSDGALITSSSSGAGDAGKVIIEGQNSPVAGPVTIMDTTILSDSRSTGNAGLIMIDAAGDITLANNTTISAQATGPGDGGNVDVTTTKVLESTNTKITTEAFSGKGGSIKIAGLTKTVLDSTTVSAEVKDPNGEKIGGDITITGGQTNARNPNFGNEQLLLRNGTDVSASSAGKGNAGTVKLQAAGTLRLTQNSNVTTTATQASGGDIELNADFMIHLLNSKLESSVGGGDETTGGNIRLDPEFIIIQNSQILAQATAGTGGNIDLISNVFLRDAFSTIDATSSFGASGIITVASALQNLSGAIAPLPETIIQTVALYGEQCAAQKGGEFSSLSLRGRDRIPFEPGDYLLTPLLKNKPGDDLLQHSRPSLTPMASRLGLPVLDTEPLAVFTSVGQGGCRS
ncbi:MAG: hypothetical protein NPIRA01_07940 [Nitrospirales bacterium]|nr:MAG: hypothetical protein NPIRA01_07940 [Nitrospirales bacterium]